MKKLLYFITSVPILLALLNYCPLFNQWYKYILKWRMNCISIKTPSYKSKVKIRHGRGNRIFINKNVKVWKSSFEILGNHNEIIVDSGCSLNCANFIISGSNCRILIHQNTKFAGTIDINCFGDDVSIVIGENCLFSSEIYIRTTDSHKIIDSNGDRINPDKSIVIGDKCWIGYRAMLLKGTQLPHGTIVSAGSIVTKKFEDENCVIGGVPAKTIKHNAYWEE